MNLWTKLLPGSNAIFIGIMLLIVGVLITPQLGNFAGLFGWQTRGDLKGEVAELRDSIALLQAEVNNKSGQIEQIKNRHIKELEAIRAVYIQTEQINNDLRERQAMLDQTNRELNAQVDEIETALAISGEFDLERYIVLPRAEVEMISINNYSTLLEHIAQAQSRSSSLDASSSESLSTKTNAPPFEQLLIQVTPETVSKLTPELVDIGPNNTENLDQINAFFNMLS